MTGESPTGTRIRAPEPPEPPGQPFVPSFTAAVVTTDRRETAALPAVAGGPGGLPAGDGADDLLLQW